MCAFCVLEDKTRSITGQSLSKDLYYYRKPIKRQTDQGTEFLNRVFQKFFRDNIDFFPFNSGLKALAVERFHRTFKSKMYKYFTPQNTPTYTNELPQIVSYNNTYHRSIYMKPSQVTKAN